MEAHAECHFAGRGRSTDIQKALTPLAMIYKKNFSTMGLYQLSSSTLRGRTVIIYRLDRNDEFHWHICHDSWRANETASSLFFGKLILHILSE